MAERMEYGYTAYYDTEEERINAIVEDMKKEYPRLGSLLVEAARMETPFGQVHEDYELFADEENRINRLINIIILTEGKPEFSEEYKKACSDLTTQYGSWTHNFTYANPEEQAAYLVCERFFAHRRDPKVSLINFKQAREILRKQAEEKEAKRRYEYEHTMRYDYTAYYETEDERIIAIVEDIKREYPNLGELLIEAARMETPFGRVHEDLEEFASQENHMNRLIDIIILTEGKPEFIEEYNKACEQFMDYYNSWNHCFSYANKQDQVAYVVGETYIKHQHDKSIPLLTFAQVKEILQGEKLGL